MKPRAHFIAGLMGFCATAFLAVAGETAVDKVQPETSLGIGGAGGVYFLASPGKLVIDLHKRDRNNRRGVSELRAILAGPDRRVIKEITIPDDGKRGGGGLGPVQRATLTAEVDRPGIYALNVTISGDRYGHSVIWGFKTNCERYLIETSRGHKDERHQEPIVMHNPGVPGDVCFLPRRGKLAMEVTDLPKGIDSLKVYDADGRTIAEMSVNSERKTSHCFEAAVPRDTAPWRLHLPSQEAVVHIDGVTRWDRGGLYSNLSLWTNDASSFFPFHPYRWLITPYSRTVYGRPGERQEVVFRLNNNSDTPQATWLSIEFPDAEAWSVELGSRVVVLQPKETLEIPLQFTVPEKTAGKDGASKCHLRATPATHPEVSTYATLIVKHGEPPAARPLKLPLTFKPYQHENEQLGYLPDYPLDAQVYFDMKNRPYVRMHSGIATLRDGQWVRRDFNDAVKKTDPPSEGDFVGIGSKIAFDADNDVYALARIGNRAAMLRSTDGGKTFSAHLFDQEGKNPGGFDIEQFSGHNVPDGPPPVVRVTRTSRDRKLRWRSLNDLDLFLPEKTADGLRTGPPIRISSKCIGLSAHSGIPSTIVSRAGKVHVIWAEATDPDEKVPGVPTYVITCDRATRKLSKPVLIGYGPPPNDCHNTPSITMDSRGFLHALVGTHGRTFKYARSLRPNDASSGWTTTEDVGPGLRQTYVGLVCDETDTLHLVFRLWHSGEEPFPHSTYPTLSHMLKRPDGPWEKPRHLVVPPFSEYSIFYHRLTVDRRGRLFLSYDYWSTYWFYRMDHWGSRRSLMMSEDAGQTWRLVRSEDMQNGR